MRSSASICPPRSAVRSFAAAAAVAVAVATLLLSAPLSAGEVSDDRASRLEHLVRHDCGSCHGMTMKGGLGPALLPVTLKDRDEDGLVQMILYGNPAKAMPPWGALISEDEARWIIRRLKRGLNEGGNVQ